MFTTFIFTVLLLVLLTSSVFADPNLPFSCTDFSQLKPDQRIICENTLPGNPTSEWDINAHGDPSIQGFSTDISFHVGTTASFKINTSEEVDSYRVDIFRMGYYNGLGARKVATIQPTVTLPFLQPPCRLDPGTYEFSCRDWKVTATWNIPADAASGVYIARPVRTDNKPHKTWRADNSQAGGDPRFAMPGYEGVQPTSGAQKYGANGMGKLQNPIKEPEASHIYFVVRDDSAKTDIVFQTADTVWQAYNPEGGASTYLSFAPHVKHRCYKASYDRPLRTREIRPANAFLGSEFPMIQFLEKHGYSVSYISGVDTDRLGYERLLQHKLFLSVGHDEYWSGRQRANLEAAQEKGGLHIAFLAGNEMFWRIRWEDNYRTMVVFKETQHTYGVKLDPNETEWTGTWRDARSENPVGSKPENAIIGQIFTINAWRNDPLIVPKRFASLKWWKNTQVEDLLKDTSGRKKFVSYLRGVLGHEMDEDVDNGFRPPGVIHLSETHVENCMYVQDYGSTYDSGHGIHRLTLYRHKDSRSIVFGAGTCQWSWALAPMHDSETGIPNPAVNHLNSRVGNDILSPVRDLQQLTVTIFNEMDGVRPFYYASASVDDQLIDLTQAKPSLRFGLYHDKFLPSWYKEAVEFDETFKVFTTELTRDEIAPTCEIYGVKYNPDDKKIFPDTKTGEPEPFATVFVTASDLGGGVVAGAEVSIRHQDYSRWHFGLPIAEEENEPLRRQDSKWEIVVPVSELEMKDEEYLDVDHVVETIKHLGKCRATDDSLNTNHEVINEENVENVNRPDRSKRFFSPDF